MGKIALTLRGKPESVGATTVKMRKALKDLRGNILNVQDTYGHTKKSLGSP